ncbi:CHAT domain-containing protein [Ephemerocybe angulata]|uniref:CHAT domain-containing protein n=1 Tax=Ephemerocybe angulata TaxID=980116 RepID=A0A8H6LRG9_9AGAR|nr:CHAT domain-containing protein [Tulosesus angulatus]
MKGETMHFEDGTSQAMEMCDAGMQLTMSWKCVEIPPEGSQVANTVVAQIHNQGLRRLNSFDRTGDVSALTDATRMLQRAVDLTPPGHPNLSGRLRNLGLSLSRSFQQTGELPVIANAIAVQQKAVDSMPPGHADLPALLNNLGLSFACRFERTTELSDIASAISALQRAVDICPHGYPGLPVLHNSLGSSFLHRFERTGDLSDIAECISALQKAAELTPQAHPSFPYHLNNLGGAFLRRFERTKEVSDISDAISALQNAVETTPQGHPESTSRLNNLGAAFLRRFDRSKELSDLAGAISVQRKVVEITPRAHPKLPSWLTNLGGLLVRRFEKTAELPDIVEAIAVFERSLELTPKWHPSLPITLMSLGGSFYHPYYIIKPQQPPPSVSRKLFSLPPNIGLPACSNIVPQSTDLIHAVDRALGLAASMAGLERTVRGRHSQLENTSGLGPRAAAMACNIDRVDKAVEWLEQGRCLVWGQLNNLRTPLEDLRLHDETLAQSIEDISRALEDAGTSRQQSHLGMPLSEKISLEGEARVHLDLARNRDELLKQARAIPGFESFLMPSPCSAIMQHLPESGPIILINVDELRCDALALLAGLDEPLQIPLSNFSTQKANTYRTILDTQLRSHSLRSREVEPRGVRPAPIKKRGEDLSVHRVLRGLFEEVVRPILDALGFSKVDRATGEVPPRLWWCPTGALSFLPLHAAGIYTGSNLECVNDYAVSSYTPTITALTDRVKNHRLVDSASSGLFLTSQPNVHGAQSIPGTTREIRCIFEQAKERGIKTLKLEGDELTVAECLEHMQAFSCIHLACHGSQNAAEPLQSRFLFHKGSLELGTILKSNLKHADLAFLSACQTSTGKEILSDEAVHLAAGMLAAGYRRVVGTMWGIGDKAGQDVATSFYEYLFTRGGEDGVDTFDGRHSAVALHHATEKLRLGLDVSDISLLTWIPFVHFGL